MTTVDDFGIARLGAPRHPSPLALGSGPDDGGRPDFTGDDARVLADVELRAGEAPRVDHAFEKAGPRARIFFEPKAVRAAVVTCGGLCPGINNVVRSLVMVLRHAYGVPHVIGFRYGYEGLGPDAEPVVELTHDRVHDIHRQGGSLLGLSRGAQDVGVMVDTLVRERVDVLFTIGGDGTLSGAHALAQEIARRKLPIGVVGIPKTIDNDIVCVDKTFGFETAVEEAKRVIDAAHVEALGARRGVGIVKLMGRESGFIAAAASVASRDVNFCLVPEVPFSEERLLAALGERLARRGHALVVIAEGCAASLAREGEGERDASGNVRYAKLDCGVRLRDRVEAWGKTAGGASVKYIDPSYLVRGVPANATDAAFCDELARHAAHAAMAGFTDLVVGRWHRIFTHVPLVQVAGRKRRIDPEGAMWLAVREATGQPELG